MPRPKGSKNKATVAKLNKQLQSGPVMNLAKTKVPANPLDKMTDAEVVNIVRERFDVMHKFARGTTEGAIRSLIISGAPGVGKSHTINWVLEAHAQKNPSFRYKVITGAMTAVNLFKVLQDYKNPGNVVVLDDTDSIFFDEQGVAILKAALDSGERRRISWLSESAALRDKDSGRSYDTEFDYEGTMIFITNTDFQGFVDEGKSKLAPHFEALISRSIYLDLKLRGRRAVALWVKHLVLKNNILVDKFDLSAYDQDRALDYIVKNRDRLRSLSLREALKLAQMIKTDPKSWERTADVVLLRGDMI